MPTKSRKRRKIKTQRDQFERPTPEREQHSTFQPAGAARRVTPVIDTLLKTRQITEAEYAALLYYRQQADACSRSPTRDSCDFSVRGCDITGPGARIVFAKNEVDRMNRRLGNLRPVVQAVVVDDVSLTQWAISEGGSREERRQGQVRFVPRNPDLIDYARWDLKFAARRMGA